MRHDDAQQPVEREPGFGPHDPARTVEADEAVEQVGDDQPSVLVEAHVAIGAPEPVTERGRATGREARLVKKGRAHNIVRRRLEPSPG